MTYDIAKASEVAQAVLDKGGRVLIVGAPGSGKSTFVHSLVCEERMCADPLGTEREHDDRAEYVPPDLGWSETSQYVADEFFTRAGPWLCEGAACVRALRKWRSAHEDDPQDFGPAEMIVILTSKHMELTPRQRGYATQIANHLDELSPYLAASMKVVVV